MREPIDITNANDPRLAPYRIIREPELLREQNIFIGESRAVVRRLLQSDRFEVRSVWVTDTACRALAEELAACPELTVLRSELSVFKALAGFPVHRGCLAVATRHPGISQAELLALNSPLLVALDAVTNPDNVGGIFRSALAFGAGAVLLSPRCCEPLYRKAIRTSVGATLRLPYHWTPDLPHLLGQLAGQGYHRVALHPQGDATPLPRAVRHRRTVLVIGNEGAGISSEVLAAVDERVTIPMSPEVDSLNANVAASIALHTYARL